MGDRSEQAKMLAGDLYYSADPDLVAARARASLVLSEYNATSDHDGDRRSALLSRLFGSIGADSIVKPIFACDYGFNIRLGRGGFINYNCVFLDCAAIEIGDWLQMGPAVQLYAAEHPLDPLVRRSGLESARRIHIGNDVWIGGGAIILGGVTIGDGSVIGAGSVVTRDVPAASLALGNPARIVRPLAASKPR